MTVDDRAWFRRWWFPLIDERRVVIMRILAYAFVWFDVFVYAPWVAHHAYLPAARYRPLLVARVLHLPRPTPDVVHGLEVILLISAAIALVGRWPRLAGWTVFGAYVGWMLVAMSYGKVDHDRFAFLVALAVLPTVGRASWNRGQRSEAAGWAIRGIQIAVVATYFLSAFAKVRQSGWWWVNSGVFAAAILRRGTFLADPLLHVPWLLRGGQWALMAMELATPILLFLRRDRWLAIGVGVLVVFHVITYAALRISFWPTAVCLATFLPLERLTVPRRLASVVRAIRRRPEVEADQVSAT